MTNRGVAPRFRTVAVAPDPSLGLRDEGGLLWTRAGEGFSASGVVARFDPGTGPGRFARAVEMLNGFFADAEIDDEVRLPGTGPLAFGSFTFDEDAAGSVLVVPEVVLARRGGRAWMTYSGTVEPRLRPPPPPSPIRRVRYAGSSLSEIEWLDAVAAAERGTRSGVLTKVVLARDLHVWSEDRLDPATLTARLAERFPQCFTFLVEGLVGATPELLVSRVGDRAASLVLAGSAARGADPVEDDARGDELLRSDKDRREHLLAVDSVTQVLRERCSDVEVAPVELLRLDNVQHLASRVAARCREQSSLTLAGALHPTAAVCGVPRNDALATIRSLERLERGRYSGPVGWLDANGDGEWGIALRCAEIDGDRARLLAGAGVVAGSRPEAELEETRLKLRAMQSVLASEPQL